MQNLSKSLLTLFFFSFSLPVQSADRHSAEADAQGENASQAVKERPTAEEVPLPIVDPNAKIKAIQSYDGNYRFLPMESSGEDLKSFRGLGLCSDFIKIVSQPTEIDGQEHWGLQILKTNSHFNPGHWAEAMQDPYMNRTFHRSKFSKIGSGKIKFTEPKEHYFGPALGNVFGGGTRFPDIFLRGHTQTLSSDILPGSGNLLTRKQTFQKYVGGLFNAGKPHELRLTLSQQQTERGNQITITQYIDNQLKYRCSYVKDEAVTSKH